MATNHAEACVTKPQASMLLREGEGWLLASILEGFAETKTPLPRMQWVYQYLDPYESVLYIGVTGQFLYRGSQHSRESVWIEEASSVRYELWCCRIMAESVEAESIHRLSPKHNIQHNLGRKKGMRVNGCYLCSTNYLARRFALPGDKSLAAVCPACGSTDRINGPSTVECSGCGGPWLLGSRYHGVPS